MIPKRLQWLAVAGASLMVLSLTGFVKRDNIRRYYLKQSICDPFAQPGYLHFDEKAPLESQWVPFSDFCPPSPDWLGLIEESKPLTSPPSQYELETNSHLSAQWESAMIRQRKSLELLDFLRDSNILILGDSVDRNGIEHLATILKLNSSQWHFSSYNREDAGKNIMMEGWDSRNIPHMAELDWMGARIFNGFYYGLDDLDEFKAQGDWHPPGLAEDRIDQLFLPMTEGMGIVPNFISLHSGLWDLAFFGRRDKISGEDIKKPLSLERMEWWQNRMISVIRKVKDTWPGVPIWMRLIHRVGDNFLASWDWSPGVNMGEGFQNFFSDIRIHQIREMQKHVSRLEGIPYYDFGHIWEGFQPHQDKVHPVLFPGGLVYNQALIHHIWMESRGRHNWVSEPHPVLEPLDKDRMKKKKQQKKP